MIEELGIEADQGDEEQGAEDRRRREGHVEELDELVGQLVVPLVFRLESDDLADEGEQGNGQDESAEEQVDLRNDPDCDPASP